MGIYWKPTERKVFVRNFPENSWLIDSSIDLFPEQHSMRQTPWFKNELSVYTGILTKKTYKTPLST